MKRTNMMTHINLGYIALRLLLIVANANQGLSSPATASGQSHVPFSSGPASFFVQSFLPKSRPDNQRHNQAADVYSAGVYSAGAPSAGVASADEPIVGAFWPSSKFFPETGPYVKRQQGWHTTYGKRDPSGARYSDSTEGVASPQAGGPTSEDSWSRKSFLQDRVDILLGAFRKRQQGWHTTYGKRSRDIQNPGNNNDVAVVKGVTGPFRLWPTDSENHGVLSPLQLRTRSLLRSQYATYIRQIAKRHQIKEIITGERKRSAVDYSRISDLPVYMFETIKSQLDPDSFGSSDQRIYDDGYRNNRLLPDGRSIIAVLESDDAAARLKDQWKEHTDITLDLFPNNPIQENLYHFVAPLDPVATRREDVTPPHRGDKPPLTMGGNSGGVTGVTVVDSNEAPLLYKRQQGWHTNYGKRENNRRPTQELADDDNVNSASHKGSNEETILSDVLDVFPQEYFDLREASGAANDFTNAVNIER